MGKILAQPFTLVERSEFIAENQNEYRIEILKDENDKELKIFALLENEIVQDGEIVIDPEYDTRRLNSIKQAKIEENDQKRDIALNQGVTYKNILFDSDTDQKVNLLAMVPAMSETDTIEWYGMNNNVLICTKEDLLNIGGLITQLHTFCWTKNAEIKQAIGEAATTEEVEAIEIDYTRSGL